MDCTCIGNDNESWYVSPLFTLSSPPPLSFFPATDAVICLPLFDLTAIILIIVIVCGASLTGSECGVKWEGRGCVACGQHVMLPLLLFVLLLFLLQVCFWVIVLVLAFDLVVSLHVGHVDMVVRVEGKECKRAYDTQAQ